MTTQQRTVLSYGLSSVCLGAGATMALETGRTEIGVIFSILTAVLLGISIVASRARPLRVFVDDYPSYWVAYDMADLKALLTEHCGADHWDGEDAYNEEDGTAPKAIWCRADGAMATEDEVEAGGCTLVTKTWAEWAAKNGRGYMGGAE